MVHSLVFYYGEHPKQNASLNLSEDFNNTLLKTLMKYLIINNLLYHYFIILKNFKLDLFHFYCYLIFQCLLFNYFLSFNYLYLCWFIYLLFTNEFSSVLSNYLLNFFKCLINFLFTLNLAFNYFYCHFLKYLEFFYLIL